MSRLNYDNPELERMARLERARSNAETTGKLEEERRKEVASLGLPTEASWEQIISALTSTELCSDESVLTEPVGEIAYPKLELPRGAT